MNTIIFYVLITNLMTFIIYGNDKERSKSHTWRIPEYTLLMLAVLGGCYGAALGMKAFHHKTRKPVFRIIVPLFACVWTILYTYIIVKENVD